MHDKFKIKYNLFISKKIEKRLIRDLISYL
jgi:hypothetical protein